MSIISSFEIAGRNGAISRDWTRTYRRVFRVVTSDPHVGPRKAAEAVGLQIGDAYRSADGSEFDNGSYVQNISVDEEAEDGRSWIITYDYGPYDPTVYPENPLFKGPEVQWGWAPFTRIIDCDCYGHVCLNSAGDPFDPPIEADDPHITLTIVRNEPSFSPDRAYTFRNAINADSFLGLRPYVVKVNQISGVRQWDPYLAALNQNGGFYWSVTYEFHFNPDTWINYTVDRGMRKLNPATGKQAPIMEGGAEITSPRNLDGNGQPLPIGSQGVLIEFHIYPELTFAGLMIEYPGP